jgi:hypothetical protein
MTQIKITDNYKKQDSFRKEFVSLLEKYNVEIEDFYPADSDAIKPGSDIHFQGEDIDISLNDILTYYMKYK